MPTDVALLIIRAAIGFVMIAHGVKHARGREKTTAWFSSIGYRQPALQWFFSTATEIGVGVLLVAGALTSFAAAGLVAIMLVAFITVHRYAGFWITARPDEGWEYVFVIAAAGFALAISGPGEYSVDDALGIADDLDGWIGLIFAVVGVLAALGQTALFYRPSEATTGEDTASTAEGAFPES